MPAASTRAEDARELHRLAGPVDAAVGVDHARPRAALREVDATAAGSSRPRARRAGRSSRRPAHEDERVAVDAAPLVDGLVALGGDGREPSTRRSPSRRARACRPCGSRRRRRSTGAPVDRRVTQTRLPYRLILAVTARSVTVTRSVVGVDARPGAPGRAARRRAPAPAEQGVEVDGAHDAHVLGGARADPASTPRAGPHRRRAPSRARRGPRPRASLRRRHRVARDVHRADGHLVRLRPLPGERLDDVALKTNREVVVQRAPVRPRVVWARAAAGRGCRVVPSRRAPRRSTAGPRRGRDRPARRRRAPRCRRRTRVVVERLPEDVAQARGERQVVALAEVGVGAEALARRGGRLRRAALLCGPASLLRGRRSAAARAP